MILRDAATGKEYSISLPCLIGRGREADLVLPDPAVSHRHALLDATPDDQLWIKDLESTNGVWVNGGRISTKTFLHPGDFIQVGKMKFLLPAPAAASAEQTVVLHVLDRSRAAPELDRRRLELIYDITTELPGSRDVTRLSEKIFVSCREYFQQDHGVVALFQEDGSLKPLCCDYRDSALPLSRSIVKRVLQNGESLLLEDALSSDSFKKEESIINLRIRSAMCAPLIYHNQINGLIYLDRNIPGAYSNSDLELFQSIAAIIAPLIENARLWSELQKKYADTVDKLRTTEARLIDTERVAAYVRLAQAMAHEVRNPLVSLGGLIRRIARPDQDAAGQQLKMQSMVKSVERIESVLQEVDDFARISLPEKQLVRMDLLVQEVLDDCREELGKKQVHPQFASATANVMAPVDRKLMKKALAAACKEILFGIGQGSELPIRLGDGEGGALAIRFGQGGDASTFRDPFAPVFRDKPWCNSLFLNIAHKILLDHGGKLLLNTEGHGVLPLVMLICRSITVESEMRGESTP